MDNYTFKIQNKKNLREFFNREKLTELSDSEIGQFHKFLEDFYLERDLNCGCNPFHQYQVISVDGVKDSKEAINSLVKEFYEYKNSEEIGLLKFIKRLLQMR